MSPIAHYQMPPSLPYQPVAKTAPSRSRLRKP